MDSKKKISAIIVITLMVAVSVFLGVMNGKPNKGSENAIDFSNSSSEAPAISASEKLERGLTALVDEGFIDDKTKDIVSEAGKKYESMLKLNSSSQDATAKINETITLSALKEKNLISPDIYDKVIAAVGKQEAAATDKKFKPLLTTGAFADTKSAEKAYDTFIKQYNAKYKEEMDTVNKEIESAATPLTDAEKQQKKDSVKAGKNQRINDVLSAMVSSNTITKIQSEALKDFVTN